MQQQGPRGTVYQRVRNKNNLEEMHLKRQIGELEQRLDFEMYRIEMERLDWKMFLKDVRNCESDDLSEFAPLFEEFLGNGSKSRRTRFRDLFKPGDIGVDERNPLKLDYKTIKAAAEKLRVDFLADVAKLRNDSTRSRRSSRYNTALLESEMSFVPITPQAKTTLTLPKTPQTPADKGAIITQPEKECQLEEGAGFAVPMMSRRNETMLEPIPGSPDLTAANHGKGPKGEAAKKPSQPRAEGNGISTSLPQLTRKNSGVITDSSNGFNRAKSILGSRGPAQEKKKFKRKSLANRIKDFYNDIQLLYTPKEDDLYLPPIIST